MNSWSDPVVFDFLKTSTICATTKARMTKINKAKTFTTGLSVVIDQWLQEVSRGEDGL